MAHAGREAAATLGRVGVWANLDRARAAEVRSFAREVEALAFGSLWYPETLAGKEALSLATLLLDATERLVVATGIASIWARDAMAAANGARAIAEAFPGRFVLGLGVSHAPSASVRGHRYERPYEAMVAYLDALDATRYVGPEPAPPAPRLLAALGPRMLRLAGERAAGERASRARRRPRLRAGVPRGGRASGGGAARARESVRLVQADALARRGGELLAHGLRVRRGRGELEVTPQVGRGVPVGVQPERQQAAVADLLRRDGGQEEDALDSGERAWQVAATGVHGVQGGVETHERPAEW